jgi:hypothetical protein
MRVSWTAGYPLSVVRVKVAAVLAGAVLLVGAGCRPSQPGPHDWQEVAEQSVSDVVSEVATSRLTLRQWLRDRFVGRYPIVVLTYSEEAAGSASDRVTTVQPPASGRATYDDVSTALQDANDAITEARTAVTAGDAAAGVASIGQLTTQLRQLRRLDARLKAALG